MNLKEVVHLNKYCFGWEYIGDYIAIICDF